jgi:plastocyanin
MLANRIGVLVSVAALSSALACGGSESPPASTTSTAPPASPVDAATAATITGRVGVQGNVPKPEVISTAGDPMCAREGTPTQQSEYFVVSSEGGLDNVFVYVKNGLGDRRFAAPTTAAVLDQQGCRYKPHVLGVMVGQPLEVLNSDDTLHNVHAVAEINEEFNIGQPIKGMKTTHTFTAREVMVPFKCDVHGWMNAYVGVLEHPYFAVTSGGGRFELKTLPPGTYEIEAWHEKLGTQTQQVTVGEKETKDISFTFTIPSAQ